MERRKVLPGDLLLKERRDSVDTERVPVVTTKEYRRAVKAAFKRVEKGLDEREKISELIPLLRNLLQSRRNAPLHLWWMLSAVEKATWRGGEGKESLELGSAILGFARRMFASLKSLSAVSADGRTALSAVAPVVCLLNDVAYLLSKWVGSLEGKGASDAPGFHAKKFRKLRQILNKLIRDLLGFTFLCQCRDSRGFEVTISLPPAPSVSIPNASDLCPAFPLANKNVAKIASGDPLNAAVVAEAVATELVLLQLVLEIIDRRRELKKQNIEFRAEEENFSETLRQLAVHSVCAGSSGNPSEMLLGHLLEERLPVLELLDAKEEALLRGVLFDAVLVDPPMFRLDFESDGLSDSSESSRDHQSVIFLKKLAVARQAVHYFRSRDQRSKLLALSSRIASWQIPFQLLNWFKSQKQKHWIPATALHDQTILTNWLVNLIDDKTFTAMLNKRAGEIFQTATTPGVANTMDALQVENGVEGEDEEAAFFVDTRGENRGQDAADLDADVDFTTAAKNMNGMDDKKRKKKKKKKKLIEEQQSKPLFKRHEHASSGIKRSRMEIDEAGLSDGSADDNVESVPSNSTKIKLKRSKHGVHDSSGDDGEVAPSTSSPSGRSVRTTAQIDVEQDHECPDAEPIAEAESCKRFEENMRNEKDAKRPAVEDNAGEARPWTPQHISSKDQESAKKLSNRKMKNRVKTSMETEEIARAAALAKTSLGEDDLVSHESRSGTKRGGVDTSSNGLVEAVRRHVPDRSGNFDDVVVKRMAETPRRDTSSLGTPSNVQAALVKLGPQRRRSKEHAEMTESVVRVSEGAPCLEDSPPAMTEVQLVKSGAGEILVDLDNAALRQGRREELSSSVLQDAHDVKASSHKSIKGVQEEMPPLSRLRSSKKKRVKENVGNDSAAQVQIYDGIRSDLVSKFANVSSADIIDSLQASEAHETDQQADSREWKMPTKRKTGINEILTDKKVELDTQIESGAEAATVRLTKARTAGTSKVVETSVSREKQGPGATRATYKRSHPSHVDSNNVSEELKGTVIPSKVSVLPGTPLDVMSERNNGRDDPDSMTPMAVVKVLERQQPASRGRLNGDSVNDTSGVEAAAKSSSPRRTRSGRSFGSPSPTPTPRRGMRRKLALDPVEEEAVRAL